MTLTELRKFIKHYLDSFDDDSDRCDETVEVIRDIKEAAIELNLPRVAEVCASVKVPFLALSTARIVLCECLALLPTKHASLLTTADVAERLQVNRSKVLGWIAYGRLKAVNTAKGALGRPRWRIKQADLDDFLAGRTGRA